MRDKMMKNIEDADEEDSDKFKQLIEGLT